MTAILASILIWLAVTVGGIVLIIAWVDGLRYGGPRFRDWRYPVLTFGGVGLFVLLMIFILGMVLQVVGVGQ